MKDESKYTPVSGRCLSSNLVQEVSDYTTALFIMWTVMALVACEKIKKEGKKKTRIDAFFSSIIEGNNI